jgi:hypothetical protein
MAASAAVLAVSLQVEAALAAAFFPARAACHAVRVFIDPRLADVDAELIR